MVLKEVGILSVLFVTLCVHIDARSVENIRSDAIVTYYPDAPGSKSLEEVSSPIVEDNPKKPGWMVRTLRNLFFTSKSNDNKIGNNVKIGKSAKGTKAGTHIASTTKISQNINDKKSDKNQNDGKVKTQLMRFGDITSRVSNSLGGTAMKVTAIVEKLCKMLKTIIPIVAAVCNVGQFQFCMSADAPELLAEAMNTPMNTMDLNSPDK